MKKTEIDLAGIKMKNPVMLASGTFGDEYAQYIDINKLGAIITKTVTLKPREGNPPPRICETPAGMLNSVGLQNKGIDAFIKEELPKFSKYDVPLIVNIGGETIDEYLELMKIINSQKIDGIEVNISCPNVEKGCMSIGVDAGLTHELIEKLRGLSKYPLIVKLTPNTGNISEIAEAAADAGADALSLINTILGMAIDVNTRKPKIAKIIGGLSGPAIKPIALRMVWEVSQKVDIPIIGIGGISSAQDAVEFMLAGASAVQIGTANFVDTGASLKIIAGIEDYVEKNKLASVADITGMLIA